MKQNILIHPDLNPETDNSPELQELWQRILIAYGKNSVKELSKELIAEENF